MYSVRNLMEYGLAHVTVHIGIQLGYEDEKILSGTPEELLKQSIDGLCVAPIENETRVFQRYPCLRG